MFVFFGISMPVTVSQRLIASRIRYGGHERWVFFGFLWLLSHLVAVCLLTVAFPVMKAVVVKSREQGPVARARRIAIGLGLSILALAYVGGVVGMIVFW